MTTGKPYQIVMAPSAHRRFCKFDRPLQGRVKAEAKKLAQDPHALEELKGPLKSLRSYKFSFKGQPYRIAYRINEKERQIEIVLVHHRQGFYNLLRQIVG